jgi:hypothetical protein
MSSMEVKFRGQSMWPFLTDGDELLVETSESTLPSSGEIWLLRTKDREWIAHRYLGDGVFKGDFSTCFESADEFQLWGRVIGHRTNGSTVKWNDGRPPFSKTAAWLSAHLTLRPARWVSLSVMWLAARLSNHPLYRKAGSEPNPNRS